MIEEAITKYGPIIIIASNIKLFGGIIENVMTETNVVCSWSISFIPIGRQIGSIATI